MAEANAEPHAGKDDAGGSVTHIRSLAHLIADTHIQTLEIIQ
jgi:hypothetical protein